MDVLTVIDIYDRALSDIRKKRASLHAIFCKNCNKVKNMVFDLHVDIITQRIPK